MLLPLHFVRDDSHPRPLFWIAARPRRRRLFILPAAPLVARGWLACAEDTPNGGNSVGDAPDKIHPLFCAALLSAAMWPPIVKLEDLSSFEIPRIAFETGPEVRRSMTLNAMRMTTEFQKSDSLRVLELVENRLALGQRDIIHDLMVYVMRGIFDARLAAREERDLRAESVAAYLGLETIRVQNLLGNERLSASRIAQKLANGDAGTVRRALDLDALLAGQIALLQPELAALRRRENDLLFLLDEVVARLNRKCTP